LDKQSVWAFRCVENDYAGKKKRPSGISLASGDDGEAVCHLCLDGGVDDEKRVSHCDVIVRAEAKMPDLSTSRIVSYWIS
jgi:hypothetical protein